ncbi:MAG: hypothetical protein V8R91_12365 [Butyricimonas faecihominis]
MKQVYRLSILLCLMVSVMSSFAQKKTGRVGNEYVVLASKAVQQDAAWMQVVNALKEKHGAEVFFYEKAPRENLGSSTGETALRGYCGKTGEPEPGLRDRYASCKPGGG